MWVELEAELGSGYLQRLESGRVAQPVRPTLERILMALGARYSERRDVLELFGYTVATDPPTEADIAWAREVSSYELQSAQFPAYMLDCTVRLHAWNRFVPKLIGVDADAPALDGLTSRTLLALWFDPGGLLAPLVAEPDVFLPSMIRAFRYELELIGDELWAARLVDELMDIPVFRHYWEQVEREHLPATAARSLSPVRLRVPDEGVLAFRLSVEHFTRDQRFRVVYFLPADPETMQACARWASAEPRTSVG
jgi:hypothetical protein